MGAGVGAGAGLSIESMNTAVSTSLVELFDEQVHDSVAAVYSTVVANE
jgi:hypothetical protein